MRQLILFILLCLGMAACGQKGDLYLPGQEANVTTESRQV